MKLNLSIDEATQIVMGARCDWEPIVESFDTTLARSRSALDNHQLLMTGVFRQLSTGRCYLFSWADIDDDNGCPPFYYHDGDVVTVERVEQQTVTTVQWVPVKEQR